MLINEKIKDKIVLALDVEDIEEAKSLVPEANRREAAALKPETNGPCTVQKRKTRGRGLRGRGTVQTV